MVMARHGAWHSIWYGLVGKESCMVWPGWRGMIYGYGLAGMAWYMVWPGGQGMEYGMAWWARHDIWYGRAVMAWYMLWPGGHYMV